MSRKKFQIDYAEHMAECDLNYMRLARLLPDLAECDAYQFAVAFPATQKAVIDIQVLERTPYTTTLKFERQSEHEMLQAKALTVRVYEDAQIAEVLACETGKQLRSRYHYPNRQMYQQDEKVQLNRFLGEWLSYCLDFGHTLDPISQALG